jgi:hypothetical protein
MKKLIIALAIVLTVFMFTGCASVTVANSNLAWYSTTSIDVRAEKTNTVWLGMFGKQTYPLAEEVALANGIKKIASVEHYWKAGVFGLWVEYTTVVTGEGPGIPAQPPAAPPPAAAND